MPTGFTQTSSDLETIVGIQFSIFSPDEIERRSVVEITSQNTYEGNEPKIGGLFDPRMGVLDNGKVCRSCGQTNHGCPGHFGHYRLTRPVYYIQFLPTIMDVLKCICIRCSKLLIDKERHKDLQSTRGEARWRAIKDACGIINRCGQENEDGCGALQPSKFTREGIARIRAHYTELKKEQDLKVEYVHRLFKRITDEDVDYMGFSRYWCRPDWMICTVLPIPPPQVRPSVVQDNNQRSEDDLTHKLFEIIKTDKALQQKIDNNAPPHNIDDMTECLQYHIATLVDNQIPGVAPSAQRSGRPLKSIQQRLGSKEGRIRYNIQGKRVEFSARSVITPDPNISISELGVPIEIASNLTYPERVTAHNRDRLYKLVQNGADTYPGAKTIVKADGRMISLKHVNAKEIVLYNGDVVNRHLLDGDIVLFNRQPTLHKMSMMAHRVKVLPYKTFRLNVLVTRPYNADFDGDEMNLHAPQSEEAAVELEEIAGIPHNIVTPRHAKPLIGVFQDSLVGSYRLTRSSNKFTRREFMNLMMYNKRFDGTLPDPVAVEDKPRYTGQQVLSQLLPPLNIEMGNKAFDGDKEDKTSENYVKIKQGVIEQGLVDADVYMKPGKGIIHVTYNDYGPKDTVDLLDALQTTVESYLVMNGFSVGISDLIADDLTKQNIAKTIQERKKQVEEVIQQVHTDLFDNNTGKTNQQEFEDQIFGILNKIMEDAGKATQASLSQENRLIAMVKSGSKGDIINISQMIATLGQISVEGKRIPYGFTDRTLPHYKKYDDGAEARGFVESSFIRGLTPQEFFFHAMSGREGLIDTAVKTAETGYIQRQLIKAMEDLVVQHDGTVRDAKMNMVQYYYGEDSIQATKLEGQSLPLAKLSHEEIRREFGMETVDWSLVVESETVIDMDREKINAYTEAIIEDQKMLVEGVFQGNALGNETVTAPVNLARLLLNMKIRCGISSQNKTDLTPDHVLDGIEKIIETTRSRHNKIWSALLRFHYAPHKLIVKERFTKKAFDMLVEMTIVNHMKTWVQPGEQVGIVAAQSIGEPSTQMTLNTFHQAGVASKSNVTRGVPRLRELLKITKNPKATSLTIYLKPEYNQSKEKAREVVQDLELTLLRNITTKVGIYWDPSDEATLVKDDKELLEFFYLFEQRIAEDAKVSAMSKWILRLELNREEMFNKNISMADVAFVVKSQYAESNIVYSDYNSDNLVMRIRLPVDRGSSTVAKLDDYTALKKFQNKLLNNTVIRGIPGIKAVTFRKDSQKVRLVDGKYEPFEQYILDTDGSNFIKVANHPAVDPTKLYTTNVHDIFDILGLEAVRAILISEMNSLFDLVGLNYRHLGLLCDMMIRTGRLMSADRYGINKNDIGPLAKMSFEETEKITLKAALFGEVDPVTGVSANVMTGQPFRGGTAFSQVMLDEGTLMELMASAPMDRIDEEEVEEGADINDLMAEDIQLTDPCSSTQFQMNLAMPKTDLRIKEDDIEFDIIEEKDE